VRCLAADGIRIRAAVRRPDRALFLTPMGDVGQVVPVQANLRDDTSVRAALEGADAAVNLVGVLRKSGRQTFDAVHHLGAGRVARLAREAGVSRLVQVSAIGAETGAKAEYARSKAKGEAAVRDAFPDATIVRPSLVFGPDDDLFNRFAAMARLLPVLPLFGHGLLADAGATRFQPVYVGDVADAIRRVLADPASAGKTYELGGPQVLSYREIMELVLRYTGRRRGLVPYPFRLARLHAAFIQLVPGAPITLDQMRLLEVDNVVSGDAATLTDLGIEPTPVESVVPEYLARYRRPRAA
jgi:NADH dehydrogenase